LQPEEAQVVEKLAQLKLSEQSVGAFTDALQDALYAVERNVGAKLVTMEMLIKMMHSRRLELA
jgi:Asp-tRNA(Asn)/Glu-tRNA(Gln) amidotransferase C subunit